MTLLRPGASPPPVRTPMRRMRAMRASSCRGEAPPPVAARDDGAMVALPPTGCTIQAMHYELYMSAALAEAAGAAARGERCDGAVGVLDAAMVASAADQVRGSGDPTAHAVMVTIREAAERMGTTSLQGMTIYAVVEPCAMSVGAVLGSDVDGPVYAVPDPL